MEIKGKVTGKKVETGVSRRSGTSWKKVGIVVQYEGGQYPKHLLLTNMQKPDDFDRIRVGDSGTFKFDGEVRESGDKYYLDLRCWSWKIEDDMPV